MKRLLLLSICVVLSAVACGGNGKDDGPIPLPKPKTDELVDPWNDPKAPANPKYLCNGKIQIGMDMDRGGAIFHFSEAGSKKNLLNRFDEGRFIQQSYYGDADGSSWNGQSWNWNPVQGGCWDSSVKGRVLACTEEGKGLRIKSVPVLWSGCKEAEDCVLQEVITLNGPMAKIKFSLSYFGSMNNKARHQELPAVFLDWDLKTFVYYGGNQPWTDDPNLVEYVPADRMITNANETAKYTEGWAAYIGDDGKGLGVYSPASDMCVLYRYGSGPGGSDAPSCSYFAPVKTMAITAGMNFSYDVYITYGTVEEIRARFKAVKAQP